MPVTDQTDQGMKKEENSRRRLHKSLLLLLKFMPMVLALCDVLNTVLDYMQITCYPLSWLSGISFFPWLFILVASFALDFCTYHRIFLYYIFVTNLLSVIDMEIGIPISDKYLIDLHCILLGVFCFLALHFYLKSRHAECYKGSVAEDS